MIANRLIRRLLTSCITLSALAAPYSHAGMPDLPAMFNGTRSVPVPSTAGAVEVGFSPEGSAQALVDKVIRSAQRRVRLAAYSFTSPQVVQALIAAKRRGVDVAVVVDAKNNLQDDRSGKGRAALNLLVANGIPTRTISAYSIHHDKYILVDDDTLQTGSYNYTVAAARYNSEIVIVSWHDPAAVRTLLAHWQSRWAQGGDYHATY